MVSLPIFIILIGVLVSISNLTTVPWNIEPTGQSMATLTDDTSITRPEKRCRQKARMRSPSDTSR